jgi:hypothetical protein
VVELNAAKIALGRAQSLIANNAGTQRGVDEARARVQWQAALQTAADVAPCSARRCSMLSAKIFCGSECPFMPVTIDEIHHSAPASVSSLGGKRNQPVRAAQPVAVPFSSAAAPATVDLFMKSTTRTEGSGPGESERYCAAARQTEAPSCQPRRRYDIQGGTWVYENTGPQTFTRRRIEVRFVSKGEAVLARGPKPGTRS